MLLSSSRGQDGDRQALRTPMKHFVQPTKLTFHFHMLVSSKSDIATSLAVFILSKLLTYERQLFVATGK